MNLFSFLVSFILSSSLVFANTAKDQGCKKPVKPKVPALPVHSNKRCTRQLEAAVYVPQTPAYEYLHTISIELKTIVQNILSQLQIAQYSAAFDFMIKYHVGIIVKPALGPPISYIYSTLTGIPHVAPSAPSLTSFLAKAYINVDGFTYDSNTETYMYSFNIISDSASQFTFTIVLDATSRSIFPSCN